VRGQTANMIGGLIIDPVVTTRDRLSDAELSATIDEIYACILEPHRWAGVLEMMCGRIDGCAASLNVFSLDSREAALLVEHGTDPECSASYVETYARLNPLIETALLHMAEGETRTLYESVDLAHYRNSRFYEEWVAPQGWGDWMGGLLIRATNSLAIIAVARAEARGSYSDRDRAFMGLLVPHLQRATRIGRVFGELDARRSGLAALAERIRASAFLLDATGRIAYANTLGERALAQGDFVREHGRVLALVDAEGQRRLSAVLGCPPNAAPVMTAVAGPGGKRIVSIMPASEATGGHVVVILNAVDIDLPLLGPFLAETYGLTSAEIRVLIALLKRRTLQDMAIEFGVTPRTIKAHLQKLFEKIGVKRQADLVGEVLGLIPAMALF
jgi:DNA-binding CsgD family transcriptional regulator